MLHCETTLKHPPPPRVMRVVIDIARRKGASPFPTLSLRIEIRNCTALLKYLVLVTADRSSMKYYCRNFFVRFLAPGLHSHAPDNI